MLLSETTEILWRIARMDHQPRDTSDEAVVAWHQLIGHLRFEDVRAAVDHHRRTETCWLQPAHVIRGAESIAAQRRRAVEMAEVAAIGRGGRITPDGVKTLRSIYAETREVAALESGRSARAIEAGPQRPEEPPVRTEQERSLLREPPESEARGLGCSVAELRKHADRRGGGDSPPPLLCPDRSA